ncbi:hypothetical protein ACQEU8_08670 [Streptomyces sp. CA-250714]|uniref:hypothetical protein n=1 Tax=Streptomyces sp. CA-250714 TaxID=3240060 RepID=UPI003D8EC93E
MPSIIRRDALRTEAASSLKIATAALLALALVSGCGEPEREYQVPSSLCGTKVDPEKVEPFLPGGKEVSEKDSPGPTDKVGLDCRLSVDGEEELEISGSWVLRKDLKIRGYDINDPTRLKGGKHIVGERAAASHFPCLNPKARLGTRTPPGEKHKTVPADTYLIEVEARHEPEDPEESKKAMKRFIVPFSEAVKKQLPCQAPK